MYMSTMKWLLAGAAAGVILIAFRDLERGVWLEPAVRGGWGGEEPEEETEPVLGYDGMDQETLLEWLGEAGLDRETLRRMRRYEQLNLAREPVLAAISDAL